MQTCRHSSSQGNFRKRSSLNLDRIGKDRDKNKKDSVKGMYVLLDQIQLKQSQLSSIKEYQYLVQQIRGFNQQLKQWKQKNGAGIRNLRMNYLLYQNLHSRIKSVNELATDRQAAGKLLTQVISWFAEQKSRVRGTLKGKLQPILKLHQQDVQQRGQLTQVTDLKPGIKPFQKIARAPNSNSSTPKQRLLNYPTQQYTRGNKLSADLTWARQLRLGPTQSSQSLNKEQREQPQTSTTSQTTRPSLKNITETTSAKGALSSKAPQYTIRIEELTQPKSQQPKHINIKEFVLYQDQKANNLRKNQIIRGLINQPKYQEDQEDQHLDDLTQGQRQIDKCEYTKSYVNDHRLSSQIVYAEQIIKDTQQSTLRRILNGKQKQMKHKLQDLNVKDNMATWAKTKSFLNQQMSRKSQSYRCANQFHKGQHTKKILFQKSKQITEFDFQTHRSRNAQAVEPMNIQQAREKYRIDDALENFGKYIRPHVSLDLAHRQNQHSQGLKFGRAVSLTALNVRPRRKQLSQVLAEHQIDIYNQQVNNQVISLKEKLSKKLVPVNKIHIYTALSAVKTQRLDQLKIFPKIISLSSNPFFPKSLYQTKKKKKK